MGAHPLRMMYAICFIIVTLTVFLPLWALLKSQKFTNTFHEIIERIALLVTLYLVMDIGSVVIILIRNL